MQYDWSYSNRLLYRRMSTPGGRHVTNFGKGGKVQWSTLYIMKIKRFFRCRCGRDRNLSDCDFLLHSLQKTHRQSSTGWKVRKPKRLLHVYTHCSSLSGHGSSNGEKLVGPRSNPETVVQNSKAHVNEKERCVLWGNTTKEFIHQSRFFRKTHYFHQ